MLYVKNDKAKQIFRMIFFILCISGIVLQYANASIADANAVRYKDSTLMLNAYYTMLTNILVCVYVGYLLVMRPAKENPMIKGGVVMSIVLTGLGYHILLANAGEMGTSNVPFFAYSNLMVHTFTPLLAVVDYFLFTPKGEYKWTYPLYWSIVPAVYVVFVYIRAALSSKVFMGFTADGKLGPCAYPYPFMDPAFFEKVAGNWAYLLLCLLGLVVIYLALGYASYGVDKLMPYIDKKIKAKKGIVDEVIVDENADSDLE